MYRTVAGLGKVKKNRLKTKLNCEGQLVRPDTNGPLNNTEYHGY